MFKKLAAKKSKKTAAQPATKPAAKPTTRSAVMADVDPTPAELQAQIDALNATVQQQQQQIADLTAHVEMMDAEYGIRAPYTPPATEAAEASEGVSEEDVGVPVLAAIPGPPQPGITAAPPPVSGVQNSVRTTY